MYNFPIWDDNCSAQPLAVWNGGNSFYKKIEKIVITQRSNTVRWKILPAFLLCLQSPSGDWRLETGGAWQCNLRYFLQSDVEVGWQYGGCTLLVSVFSGDLILILFFGWLRLETRIISQLDEISLLEIFRVKTLMDTLCFITHDRHFWWYSSKD